MRYMIKLRCMCCNFDMSNGNITSPGTSDKMKMTVIGLSSITANISLAIADDIKLFASIHTSVRALILTQINKENCI